MAETRQLNHYSILSFTDYYWQQPSGERQGFLEELKTGIPQLAEQAFLYNIFPTRSEGDLIVWSAMQVEDTRTTGQFFSGYADKTSSWRPFLKPLNTLWGFTRPTDYASGKSSQELDPFEGDRRPYLVIYPFHKTIDWYVMSREARQGMMNEHIRIGRQYTEITQLLLYSTGLQDQEFVVVYETDDLAYFSKLVTELRDTEARKYTQRDTPIYTAIYRPIEEILSGLG